MGKTLNLTDDERWVLHHLVENELQREHEAHSTDESHVEELERLLDKLD